jgi:capsid protein
LSLTDLLTGWVGQWAFGGALLAQEIVGKSVNEYRIHDLGAESLDWTKVGKNFFGGVEVDDNQQVIAYHVYDPNNPMVKDVLKKEYTLHAYRRKFAMQRIGIPSLSSSLPTAADLRDYDDQVMDAARAAADYSIIMVTDHPDSQFSTPAQTTVPVRRRTRQYATPGWKPMELKGNQPTINYGEYRKQRHADVGGTIGEMPLMIFRRNAADHTMSSSRVDTARYAKAIERWQKHIERRVLNHIVRRLVRLAQLQRLLPPTPLNKITKKLQYDFPNCVLPISWTWTKQPPIDPLKDAMAQRMRLENGTYSFSQAVAEDGNRPDEVIRLRARDNAALAKAGLPEISGALPMDPVVMQAIIAADTSEDQPSRPETTDSLEPTSPSE